MCSTCLLHVLGCCMPALCLSLPAAATFGVPPCDWSHLIYHVVLKMIAWLHELLTITSDVVERRSTVLWIWRDAELRDCAVCVCVTEFRDSWWEWELVTEWCDWQSTGAVPLSHCTVFSLHRSTVWRMLHWSHPIWILVCTTTDARLHRLFAAVSNTVPTMLLLLCAGCLLLLHILGDIFCLILCYINRTLS